MRLLIFIITLFFLMVPSYATNFPDINVKQIHNKNKIYYNELNNGWSSKQIDKKNIYFQKVKGFGDFFDYVDSNKNFVFSTNCELEFIFKGKLIGYSNRDLKFYEFSYSQGQLTKKTLTKEEIQEIIPNYKIFALSEFSNKTNSIKIKKGFGDLKVLLLNDSENVFDGYRFTSGNATFKQYDLRGFVNISKPGMIQFASNKSESLSLPWYVLLVR